MLQLTLAVVLGLIQAPSARRISVPDNKSIVRPVYRQLKPDEQRIEGLLQRIECGLPKGAVRFTLRVTDKIVRYQAPRLDAVDYIVYTPDFKGPVTCEGFTPARHVFLTWTGAGNAAKVVAVEFLPKP